MRSYVVLFNSSVAADFERRAQVLEKTAGLPPETVHYVYDDGNGQLVGIYVTEHTANRFPQFLSEFTGGEWWPEEP